MALPYAQVKGLLGVAVADLDDVDDVPELMPCTQGKVNFIPLVEEMKYIPESPDSPMLLGQTKFVCTLGSSGQLTYNGKDFIDLVDLGSEFFNPRILDEDATYKVTFEAIRLADGTPVNFRDKFIHPIVGQVNDLTLMVEAPTGSGGVVVTPGLSAYDLWLAEGNTGTPDDFFDSLVTIVNPDDGTATITM